MPELLLTSSIDPIKEGDIFPKEVPLPRHVTIWQHFMLPAFHEAAFIEDIGAAVEGFSPLEVIGADYAEFGPYNDRPVRRVIALGTRATVVTLHTVIGTIIQRHDGTIRSPEWAYENYNPHMTYVNGRALEEAEYAKLRTLELIKEDAPTRTKTVNKIWKLEEF